MFFFFLCFFDCFLIFLLLLCFFTFCLQFGDFLFLVLIFLRFLLFLPLPVCSLNDSTASSNKFEPVSPNRRFNDCPTRFPSKTSLPTFNPVVNNAFPIFLTESD